MSLVDVIVSRSTVPPVKMGAPGPDRDALRRILEAGAAAPDHGKLTPFRFLVVEGQDRERLGDLFARAVEAKPDASPAEIEKQRSGPTRAPVIVVVIAKVQPGHPKVPPVEQIASAACAAQNILLAAHALGFAGKWATGKNAYDPIIRGGLGLAPDDVLTGFLYLGSKAAGHEPSPRPPLADVVGRWPVGLKE